MWGSLRFNSCFYEWHYISGNSLQAHFFSTCLRKTLGKTEAWQDCSVCNVQVTFVSWNVIRATRSIKGAVKVAPDPSALFIYSITESVNRGLNKVLAMSTFLYVPVYTMRACTTYIASIKSMLGERCACVLRNMTVCVFACGWRKGDIDPWLDKAIILAFPSSVLKKNNQKSITYWACVVSVLLFYRALLCLTGWLKVHNIHSKNKRRGLWLKCTKDLNLG